MQFERQKIDGNVLKGIKSGYRLGYLHGLQTAANKIKDFEDLVDTYDCVNVRNNDLAISILELFKELKDEDTEGVKEGI